MPRKPGTESVERTTVVEPEGQPSGCDLHRMVDESFVQGIYASGG